MKAFNQDKFNNTLTSDTFSGLEWNQYDFQLKFKEESPKEDGSYLCLVFNKAIGTLRFDTEYFHYDQQFWDVNENKYIVLCWSDLPKIYTTMVSRDIAEIYKYHREVFVKNEEILAQEYKKNRILELEQELDQLKNN